MPVITYATFTDSNMGGLPCEALTLIAIDDIVSVSSGEITATNTHIFYYSPDSAGHTEKEKKTKQGSIYEQNIAFEVPKIRTEILDFATEYNEKYFIAVVTDANATQREVGTIAKPLQLFYQANTGKQATNRNQFAFSLEGATKKPSKISTRQVIIEDGTEGFTVGFSTGFNA